MKKKTINIPGQLASSIVMGLLLSFVTVIILHFFGSWSANPSHEAYRRQSSGISSTYYFGINEMAGDYSYSCPLGSYHSFEGDGSTTLGDILSNKPSSAKIIGAFIGSFDNHWVAIILLTIIFVGIIYFFLKTSP